MITSTSAQGGNDFNFPTQSPSSIARVKSKGHMANKLTPPLGGGAKPSKHIGLSLMGLFPSKKPQNDMKHENPINSHNIPKSKLTMQSDQKGRTRPPGSWKQGRPA